MKLWFLSHTRAGLRPSGDGHSPAVPWRARARVRTRVVSGGHAHDIATDFDLLGPGDVLGIDPAQTLRMLPAPDSQQAEAEMFPAIELDAPDLPWAYSPAAAGNRLMPWICLIVVQEQPGVSLRLGSRGQSPWLLSLDPQVAARELPDPAEAWAWAHAQVACEGQAQIGDTLAGHPDRTLSRLVAARRLLPNRRYLACVVPTFLAGRIAGVGGDAQSDAVQIGHSLAWSPNDPPTQLPVYLTWRFATGEAGDTESMLRRLRPAPADPQARRSLTVRLASGDDPQTVDWQPPLHVRGEPVQDPHPSIVEGLRSVLAPSPDDALLVGPAYLGEPWLAGRPLEDLTQWAVALNLTPMARAAAGLGADVVRERQEEIVAAVWDQLQAYREQERLRRARQLAVILENQVKGRLLAAPLTEASRVLGPRVAQDAANAKSVALRTAVGRRVTHKSWRVAGGTAIGGDRRPEPAAEADSGITAAPPPVADREALLAMQDDSLPPSTFTPSLPAPLGEMAARRLRELLLPTGSRIAPDSVLAVQVDRAFIEAFLVGANQELDRELLWRGLPADRRATAFRRFWNRTDGADDIPAIADWAPASGLGEHASGMDAGILLRSELVHRCPSLLIAAVPAIRDGDVPAQHRPSRRAFGGRPHPYRRRSAPRRIHRRHRARDDRRPRLVPPAGREPRRPPLRPRPARDPAAHPCPWQPHLVASA